MVERRSRELRVLSRLAQVVSHGPYGAGEVMDRMCTSIRADLGFERALVVRLDTATSTVHAAVQQGIDWPGDAWLSLGDFPLLQRALETVAPVFVRDARAERAAPEWVIDHFGVASVLAVPLLVQGRCIGFLIADRSGTSFDLPAEDIDLLAAVGPVAATFIDKADQFDELRSLDQAKHDFISIAAHELRVPISVVYGVAATLHLRGDELEPVQRRELRATLYEQTSRLRDLTEQLLDLSRLDAGAVSIDLRPMRPRECVDALLPRIVPDRLSDIEVTIDPELEVVFDPSSCERIVGNLVLNALCYGDPPVEVSAACNGEFLLAVEDHGCGVPPDFVPRLFERFSRAGGSRDATIGAGLGLAIAQEFAQALGGALRYEQIEPHGARFVFAMPA